MPDLPQTVNANITRIDAPFPEQWSTELSGLVGELKEIKDLMAMVAIGVTQSKSVQEEVLALYSKEAVEARASMASAKINEGQQRPATEQGEEKGVSRPPEAFHGPPVPKESPYREPEGGPSRPKTPYEESMDFLGQNSSLMPQHFGGRYTATDLLTLMAKGTKYANEQANEVIDPATGKPVSGGAEGTGLAKATQFLSRGASSWMPNAQAALNLGKSYYGGIRSGSEGLNTYAGSLGVEGGSGGTVGLGPINARIPFFNQPSLSGLGSIAEAYGTAMTIPGLSGSQVMAMNQSLAERGWFPGQKGQQELFDAQGQLISKGGVTQQLGESPEVSDLLDRGMRSGVASMEEMVATIEEIPEAAKNAHEGVQQMVQSMTEVGEFSQSQGGTSYAGQQQALDLAATTGMPVQATKGLIESPWATSAIFRATGMPSWMQGTIPGAIKNRIATNSFWSLANAVGKGEGHTYKAGGFEKYVTPVEEQAARIHMLQPNMNPETILRMLREGKTGVRGRSQVAEEAEMWKDTANSYMGSGHATLENQLLTANNVGGKNFGKLLHNMAQLKTAQGKRMFSSEDIKDLRTNFGQGWEGLHGKELVDLKSQDVQKILGRKAGKDANAAGSPGNVVIELSPAARKLLQLPNKQSRIKLEAGAGENSTVNGYTGSTDGLTPAVNSNTNGDQFYGPGTTYGPKE